MVSIKWSGNALESLDTLDAKIRERVLLKVSWLGNHFAATIPEPLHSGLKGLYKLRVGDYRVVYSIRGDTIIVMAVGHRRDIYR